MIKIIEKILTCQPLSFIESPLLPSSFFFSDIIFTVGVSLLLLLSLKLLLLVVVMVIGLSGVQFGL